MSNFNFVKNKKHTSYLLDRVRFKVKKVFEKIPSEALFFQAAG